ncbi:hypothetical protein QJS66_19720 [Kocuria rhizophila]|nr:hypothetical protein QJS66_19720 [Kocuria rhizophila]
MSTEQAAARGGVSASSRAARGRLGPAERPLHWIRRRGRPRVWERLEAIGLDHPGGLRWDTPRVLPWQPVAGGEDAIIDPSPELAALARSSSATPSTSNLPRKFKTAITGSPTLDVVHEINDVASWAWTTRAGPRTVVRVARGSASAWARYLRGVPVRPGVQDLP